MPDTKSGREKKGLDKERQLTEHLYERELDVLGEPGDEPPRFEGLDGEFIAEEFPDD